MTSLDLEFTNTIAWVYDRASSTEAEATTFPAGTTMHAQLRDSAGTLAIDLSTGNGRLVLAADGTGWGVRVDEFSAQQIVAAQYDWDVHVTRPGQPKAIEYSGLVTVRDAPTRETPPWAVA